MLDPPPPRFDPPPFWERTGRHLARISLSLAALVVSGLLVARDPGTGAASAALASLCALAWSVGEWTSRPPER